MTETTHIPEEATLRMKLGGMHCSFCVSTIKKAYSRVPGVGEVGVSLAHEEALVRYDPARVTETEVKDTLRPLGYTVRDPDKVRTFEDEEEELRRERRRLFIAAGFTVTSFLVMLLGPWTDLVAIPVAAMQWTMLTIALLTMFTVGWYIKRMAFQSLIRGILNQHNLLEFAAFGGLIGGLLGMFVDSSFPAGDFFAVATFVTTYHILSGYVSLLVRTRSSQSVRKLLALQPDTARVVRSGNEVEIPIAEVRVGDQVRVRPGESIPVDGTVSEGASAVNEALVTGEPIPSEKVPGDEVIGGSINHTGSLLIEVSRIGDESFLNQVARSIEEARALRPGLLQLVDVVLKYYVPGVLIFAGGAAVVWIFGPLLFGNGPDWFRAVFAVLAVLVMGYPCALGMATPLAMIRGAGEAAERGILMRSGEAFEVMHDLEVVVFDKTGTITKGEPSVHAVQPAVGSTDSDLLRLAAAVEAHSEHPLAESIRSSAVERGLTVPDVAAFQSHTGQGVQGEVDGQDVVLGKPEWLLARGVDLTELADAIERLRLKGQTVVAVAAEDQAVGVLGISDTVKDDAAATIAALRESGLTSVMITGDNERTARAVAANVGIDEVLSEVLPGEKAERVRDLQRQGKRVAMVGDGINDAPALTQADIGIAIGAGTDIAIESADIVIMGERLGAVLDAYQVGLRSYSKTKQNLGLAFSFNGVGVPLATTGLLHPVWAMVAMVASVTTVLVNSFAGRLIARAERQPALDVPKRHSLVPSGTVEPEAAGLDPDQHVLHLYVDMHCGSCARLIRGTLGQIDEVRSIVPDISDKSVTITHGSGTTSTEIIDALKAIGFEAKARS